MTRDETRARHQLEALAEDERGRQLLQLALRGIQTSGHGLTVGCWVKPGGGVSGCVFQHAYWQGVAEGVFETTDAASREIKQHVDERDFHAVMEAIRALDRLGKHRFVRRHGLRRELNEAAWRDTVEQLLVDVLANTPSAAGRQLASSSV
jgi:hypothetical protein